MGSFSIWHWLIVLLVVVLIFGTKKLRNIGSDVGGAVKNFKEAMGSEQTPRVENSELNLIEADVVEVQAVKAATRKASATAKPGTKKVAVAKPIAAAKPKSTTASKTK